MPLPLSNQPFLRLGTADHAVLLVHGLGGGPHEVQRLAHELHERHGLTVQAVRLPGHGGPGPRMPASTWTEWFAAVKGAHTELRARHSRVDLVGFSTGAILVLHVAATEDVAGRIVLLAPFVRVRRPGLLPVTPETLVRALPFVRSVPRMPPPLRDRVLRREVEACAVYRTFNLDATRSALTLVGMVMSELAQVRAPVLLVQGRRDSVVEPAGAARIYARLVADKRLVWIDGSDHLLTLDVDSAQVHGEAAAFLMA